jgi:DNA-binding MurR/RpiR family transcriptional regulator
MTTEAPSVTSVEQLLKALQDEYKDLSKQLKLIGKYVEAHHGRLGLEGIQDVAAACGVQPSAVVRFAKHFGFSGFTEMQKLFREAIAQQLAPDRNYQARIRDVIQSGAPLISVDIAREFLKGSVGGIQDLIDTLAQSDLDKAVELLAKAESIWLLGTRRSFPVAAYLNYALQHTDKRIQLVSGMGGMQEGQLRSLRKGDVVLAVSFPPYAPETLEVLRNAHARGARIIAITDSRLSPLAELAQAVLFVQESTTFGFRSLTSTIGLAQGLFIALAYRLELSRGPDAEPLGAGR